MNRRVFLALCPALLAAGCGFQLRRFEGLPFASLFVDAPAGSQVAQRIQAFLKTSKTLKLTATAADAEAVLKLTHEERVKTILSLSGAGRVTEYRLSLRLTYSIVGRGDSEIAAPEYIELSRDLTYDDTQVLAKGAEEQLLYRDMDDNAALRIVRRLQSLKPGSGTS